MPISFKEYLQKCTGLQTHTITTYLYCHHKPTNYNHTMQRTVENYLKRYNLFLKKIDEKNPKESFLFVEFLTDCTLLKEKSIWTYTSVIQNGEPITNRGLAAYHKAYLACKDLIQAKPNSWEGTPPETPPEPQPEPQPETQPNPTLNSMMVDIEDVITSNLRDGLKLLLVKSLLKQGE